MCRVCSQACTHYNECHLCRIGNFDCTTYTRHKGYLLLNHGKILTCKSKHRTLDLHSQRTTYTGCDLRHNGRIRTHNSSMYHSKSCISLACMLDTEHCPECSQLDKLGSGQLRCMFYKSCHKIGKTRRKLW